MLTITTYTNRVLVKVFFFLETCREYVHDSGVHMNQKHLFLERTMQIEGGRLTHELLEKHDAAADSKSSESALVGEKRKILIDKSVCVF